MFDKVKKSLAFVAALAALALGGAAIAGATGGGGGNSGNPAPVVDSHADGETNDDGAQAVDNHADGETNDDGTDKADAPDKGEAGEKERVWVVNPQHPIAQGLDPWFVIPETEMYGEPFLIPEPMETVFISWYDGGEVFRSGVTFQRGGGRIFYFSPGHEVYPIYKDKNVGQVLRNAVNWAYNPAKPWKGVENAPNRPTDKAPEPITEKGPKLHKPGEKGLR